ncbi:hypothetical protein BT96DRAFT_926061 [Gymnopus androsaceus JB14]|uniref:Uncharacterized protein n=1 Tax=Gymnopus androsaceus JB14 TaxID=1447944 RepID=A0A6A4GWP6_9AGAR|nr:hypothetical protein BT96DRAFT_926061 [Gymnopus androsaceus JB14]
MRPQTEVDDVRSQMASLQDSNEEMRATMNRMMVHVRRLEAQIEADMAEEGSDAPPPTYVST